MLVIPVPGKGLTEALANATLDAVVSELRVMVKGRAVRPITDPNVITANLACTEPACHGRIIADLNGIQGLLVSMAQPSPKKPASVVLSLLSAVDGTVNGEVQNIEIPLEQISTPLELIRAGLVALKPVLPARPAVGSLLIATSADGASISVDGKPVGTSPMAPIDVAPGTHVVSVTQPGFTTYSRSVEVTVDGARVDADLQPDAGEMKRIEDAETAAAAANAPPKPWFKRWYVWAAAGAALVLGAVIIGVAASSGGQEPFVVPPINP